MKRKVNKVIYVLLALFLGEFGLHKFYAGQNGKGILYLIFSWTLIPGLLGVIEGIRAIFQPADKDGYFDI
ncbi:TM2 domain-containing protein [Streptococcus ictaluri]|uniref:TM2 domain protein n=1 Tax=Streptococcus ictaluri 707-05 TaxID=764299 RepID=G5JZM4_9STRE|nr:NINE protein [Streptococcus ictaluri]EHI70831.1 TM2 domain protein [Streptococcus ictaluri 707-05]